MKCCKGTGVYAIQQKKQHAKIGFHEFHGDVFFGGLDGDTSPSQKKHVSS